MAFVYKINEDKSLTVNDPIYDEIKVLYTFSKIVLTEEMIRLSDITQNGYSKLEFEKLADNDR